MTLNNDIFKNNSLSSGGVNFSSIVDSIANLGGVATDIINAVNNNGQSNDSNNNNASIPDKPINSSNPNFQKNNDNELDKSFFNAGLFIVVAVFLLTKK